MNKLERNDDQIPKWINTVKQENLMEGEKIGQVTETISELESFIFSLDDNIHRLEEKLKGALTKKIPNPTENILAQRELVPIAQQVEKLKDRILVINIKLNSILDRLEL